MIQTELLKHAMINDIDEILKVLKRPALDTPSLEKMSFAELICKRNTLTEY